MLRKAYLEITNVCNLACSFCPGTRREKRFMPAREVKVLAAKIRPHTQYLYLHLMGEPLLHPELPEILEICHELDFKLIITTNGTLLPERTELLIGSPAVHKINISLQSFEANKKGVLEDYIRSCASFAREVTGAGKLCVLLYNTFYQNMNTRGVGQAKAVIFFLIVAAVGLVQLYLTRKKEVQQ